MAPGPPRRTSARGLRRREQILEAAAEVVTAQGFAGLSHRSVARQAGLPLSATTYYFASLDVLLESAVRHLAERWMAAARATLDALPASLEGEPLAHALLAVAALSPAGGPVTDDALSFYDRYLEAARRPHLRAVVVDYDARLEALIAALLHRSPARPGHARLVLAVVDGALLRCYAEGLSPALAVAPVLDVLRLLGAAQEP